jgi:hypothetical protein
MSQFRLFVILMLCLTIPMASWASASNGRFCPRETGRSGSSATAVHSEAANHLEMGAAAADHDAECGNDDCDDAQCKHKCACGCDMGTCTSSCLAFLGMHTTYPWIAATDAIPPPVAQQLDAARGTSPLRPPIP